MRANIYPTWALVAAFLPLTGAISLDINDPASIRNASSVIVRDMLAYYTGGTTGTGVGLLPAPYYWWEAGAMWTGMIDYWHYTNDTTYNSITTSAILANVGTDYDFIVPTQAFDEGNDDQAFWGMSAMTAAENSFPEPPSPFPSWLRMAQNMWDTQQPRWDFATCGGGLKWQFYTSNAGYNYKNSISNGGFFQMAARLLRFTGNETYQRWAEESWDWSYEIGLIDQATYSIYDGTDDLINCTEINHDIWSYTLGVYLLGAATMYNYTNGSLIWQERTSSLIGASSSFFTPYDNASSSDVMYETMCESTSTCNTDQQSFKSQLARSMWKTSQLAPYTAGAISTLLGASAAGAALSCTGPPAGGGVGSVCGSRWYVNGFDGVYGVGQQLSALEVVQGLLVNGSVPAIVQENVHINTTAPAVVTSTTFAVPSAATVTTTRVVASKSTAAAAAEVTGVPGVMALGVVVVAVVGAVF